MASLSAYDAIKSLRPMFLSVRGGFQSIAPSGGDPETGQVHVSIDNRGLTSLEELKQLPARTVLEIRLLTVGETLQRFGATAREGPVITVHTK